MSSKEIKEKEKVERLKHLAQYRESVIKLMITLSAVVITLSPLALSITKVASVGWLFLMASLLFCFAIVIGMWSLMAIGTLYTRNALEGPDTKFFGSFAEPLLVKGLIIQVSIFFLGWLLLCASLVSAGISSRSMNTSETTDCTAKTTEKTVMKITDEISCD